MRTAIRHELGFGLFFIFMAGLLSQTILPQTDIRQLSWSVHGEVNLIPLRIFSDAYAHLLKNGNLSYFIINFLGNILMFAPIGFFVPLLWRGGSLKKAVGLGFLCSLLIELCQLPQIRTTDIDDLWMNTAGAWLGYGCFCLIRRRYPTERFFVQLR